jgi:aspartate/methionine/tyrosine aminotransferase
MQNLQTWLAGERLEILDRRAAISDNFSMLAAQGWTLLGNGAYFAYAAHPFSLSSAELAPRLVADAGVLLLPGTMFMPSDVPGGEAQVRIAFANIDRSGIETLFNRLSDLPY